MTADELRAKILEHVDALVHGGDVGALGVLARQAERLAMGLGQYGRLDAIADKREWLEELRCELLDALVYIDNEEQRQKAARADLPTEPRIEAATPP